MGLPSIGGEGAARGSYLPPELEVRVLSIHSGRLVRITYEAASRALTESEGSPFSSKGSSPPPSLVTRVVEVLDEGPEKSGSRGKELSAMVAPRRALSPSDDSEEDGAALFSARLAPPSMRQTASKTDRVTGEELREVSRELLPEKDYSKEAKDMVAAMRSSVRLKSDYSDEDWDFLEREIAPKLLVAKDRLLEEHVKDPSTVHTASEERSPYLKVSYETLSRDSQLRANGTNDHGFKIKVRIYPSGMIVYNLPAHLGSGATKVARVSVLSHVGSEEVFRPQVEVSLRDISRDPDLTKRTRKIKAFEGDWELGQELGSEHVFGGDLRLFRQYGPSGTERLYFAPELSDAMHYANKPAPRGYNLAQARLRANNLNTIIQGALTGAEHIVSKGYLHNDHKPENLLLELEETPDGERVKKAMVADLDLCRSTEELRRLGDRANNMGTKGFHLKDAPKSVNSEIYALGVTFKELNQPINIRDSHLPDGVKEALQERINRYQERVDIICREMSAVVSHHGKRMYANKKAPFEFLRREFQRAHNSLNRGLEGIIDSYEKSVKRERHLLKRREMTRKYTQEVITPGDTAQNSLRKLKNFLKKPSWTEGGEDYSEIKALFIERFIKHQMPQLQEALERRYPPDHIPRLDEMRTLMQEKIALREVLSEIRHDKELEPIVGEVESMITHLDKVIKNHQESAQPLLLEGGRKATDVVERISHRFARRDFAVEEGAIREELSKLDLSEYPEEVQNLCDGTNPTLHKLLKHREDLHTIVHTLPEGTQLFMKNNQLLICREDKPPICIHWAITY